MLELPRGELFENSLAHSVMISDLDYADFLNECKERFKEEGVNKLIYVDDINTFELTKEEYYTMENEDKILYKDIIYLDEEGDMFEEIC